MGQPLSDTESLLWSLGRDPNLATTMGLVAILDAKPDPERLRNGVAATVAAVERLRQRVVSPAVGGPGLGFGKPSWVTDTQFELDHHFRVTRIGSGRTATDAELRRVAAQFINDPFDLARPLWQFQLVTGLAKGRAALLGKVHHSISDGIGLLRLAATLLDFEEGAAPPDTVDLEEIFNTDASGGADTANTGPAGDEDDKSTPERLFGWLQSAAQGLPDPKKLVEAGAEAVTSARTVGDQLPKTGGSPLWATRSRNRRLEFHAAPVQSMRDRAEALGVTINDLFVASCAQAAVNFHHELGVELPSITATVVVSTQTSSPEDDVGGAGDNAFIPVAITLPGSSATAEERLEIVRAEVWKRRSELREKGEALNVISAIGGLVPSSIAASLAVDQAAKVDFATSNIPGPPMPTWLAGQSVERLYPVGPVAGTAFNVTLMTYDNEALFGIHLDPAAVTDGNLLKLSLGRGLSDFGVARR